MAEARTWLAYFARHKKLLPVLKKADNIAVFIQLYWKIIYLCEERQWSCGTASQWVWQGGKDHFLKFLI